MPRQRLVKLSPKPGKLEDLVVEEVTLTKAGAIERDFLVRKTQESRMEDFEELLQVVNEIEADNEDELEKALKEADVSEKGVRVAKTIARLRNGYADEVPSEVLAKALGLEIEKDDADEDEEDDAPLSKSDIERVDDPDLRERLEKTREEVSDLRKTVEYFREKEARGEWVSKAEDLDHLSRSAEDLGQMLRDVEKNQGDDAADELFKTLKAANEAASEADLFKEVGSSGPGFMGDAEEELEKRAADLVADGDFDTLAKAQDHILETDESLRARFMRDTGRVY